MNFLLDTNVLSELARTRPDSKVVGWVDSLPPEVFFLSVLTIGEIRKGIEKLADGDRKARLAEWLEHDLPGWFGDRLLPIDAAVAERWGILTGGLGRSVPAIDSLLAATALHHGLRLATRNVDDFDFPGLPVVNPWQAAHGG